MARRVFFSFHYERDIWRVGQVRNSWLTKKNRESAGYWDAAKWEKVKKQGDDAVRRWINLHLGGTSVTVVLIGAETSKRKYVKYEIERSWEKGNGLIGITIHNIKDVNSNKDTKGEVPFKELGLTGIRTYDWVTDGGRMNLGKWIEAAYDRAQKRE